MPPRASAAASPTSDQPSGAHKVIGRRVVPDVRVIARRLDVSTDDLSADVRLNDFEDRARLCPVTVENGTV